MSAINVGKIMKISNNFIYFNTQKTNNNKQNKNINSSVLNQNKQTNLNLMNSNYPVFTGGYSLNLKDVYNNLSDNDYPKDIKIAIENEIKNSDNNKSLYDIHFDKYKGINDCYTLEELKEKYPEFNNVVSAYSVNTQEGSFINNWQNGNDKVFSSDEDLTLQLIKLYWGQGFTLNDLSKYIKDTTGDKKGTKLHYTLTKKLNIPLMTIRYARVLKLSNKEYNENFTQSLSQKLKETKEAHKQALEGEPIYIPSKPHSEAHKQHISEGLIKYYIEHPEASYKISQRQKEFYEKNPEKKDELSQIMDFAWNNTSEGKTIKKQLIKFFKKQSKNISDNELSSPMDLSKEKENLLEQFWKVNKWAKEPWSTATKKGWDSFKIFNSVSLKNSDGINILSLKCLPDKIMEQIYQLAKDNNETISKQHIGVAFISRDDLDEYNEKSKFFIKKIQKYINLYLDKNPKEDDKIATALHLGIYDFFNDLNENSDSLPPEIKNNKEVRFGLIGALLLLNKKVPIFNIEDNNVQVKFNTNVSQITDFLYIFLNFCMREEIVNTKIISDYFNKLFNRSYNAMNR